MLQYEQINSIKQLLRVAHGHFLNGLEHTSQTLTVLHLIVAYVQQVVHTYKLI